MPRPSTFALYDRIIGGGLHELLTKWREEGDSYEAIAQKLRDEHGIEVTTSTVYRWLQPEATEAVG